MSWELVLRKLEVLIGCGTTIVLWICQTLLLVSLTTAAIHFRCTGTEHGTISLLKISMVFAVKEMFCSLAVVGKDDPRSSLVLVSLNKLESQTNIRSAKNYYCWPTLIQIVLTLCFWFVNYHIKESFCCHSILLQRKQQNWKYEQNFNFWIMFQWVVSVMSHTTK